MRLVVVCVAAFAACGSPGQQAQQPAEQHDASPEQLARPDSGSGRSAEVSAEASAEASNDRPIVRDTAPDRSADSIGSPIDVRSACTDPCPTKVIYAVGGQSLRRVVVDEDGNVLTDYVDAQWKTDGSTADHHKNWGTAIGAGVIVMVGNGGTMVSTDGVTFQKLGNPPALHAAKIVFDNGRFVTVASGGAWHSTDGFNWTKGTAVGVPGHIHGLAFGNGRFVAAGDSSGLFSVDGGASWTVYAFPGDRMGGYMNGLGFCNGKFVARGSAAGFLATGTNGQTWSTAAPTRYTDGTEVDFGGALFCVNDEFLGLPGSYTRGRGGRSTDGITWTRQTYSSTIGQAHRFENVNGGITSSGIYKSADGVSWTRIFNDSDATFETLASIAVGRIRK